MLEKDSKVVLTDDDIVEYRHGRVSDRVKETWGLTFEELQALVSSKQYTAVTQDSSTKQQSEQ
jgi:hypothetical protein